MDRAFILPNWSYQPYNWINMYLKFSSFLNFNGGKFFVLRSQVNVSYLASSAAEGHSWEWLLIMKTFCILPLACHFQEFFHFLQKLWPCFWVAKYFFKDFIDLSLQKCLDDQAVMTVSEKKIEGNHWSSDFFQVEFSNTELPNWICRKNSLKVTIAVRK